MKKSLLIKLHLYCGLFTCFYLLAFGVSSIILNHKMEVDNKTVKKTWHSQVQIDPNLNDNELAESLGDQLGIMGWLPPWQFKKDSTNFNLQVTHLAKTSELEVNLISGAVIVNEIPKGFLATLHGLHFFNGRIPNAPFFLKTWIVYQWLALFVLFISLVLGLWLWLKYSYRTWELLVFGGLFIFSCLIMLLL
ncbi:MAG: hypothetical protein IPL46_20315 [Saprospiraceae bacterium]|nr:hypothetical protein [Saprospiraceae bacterium]